MAYRDKKTGHWMTDIRPRVNGIPTGQRIRKLMPKISNKREADEEERRILRDIQLELSGERRVSPMFEEFATGEYLRWVKGNKKRPHEDERLVGILTASVRFSGKRLDDIRPDDVEKFKADAKATISNRGRKLSPGTINSYLAQLSAIYRVAVAAGRARTNPVMGVRYVESVPPPFRVLEHDEEPRLLETLAESKPYLKPLAEMALATGMRLGELLALRVEDVDFGGDILYVRDPKWPEDKRRTEGIPLSSEARALLLSLKVRRGLYFSTETGAKLRQASVSARFTYQAKRAGLAGLTFHSLRHTFGTRLAKKGYKIEDVAKLLGHASTTMTMRYVHPHMDDLRAAVNSLSERPKVLDFGKTGNLRQEA